MGNNRNAIVPLRTRVTANILILAMPILFILGLELGLRVVFSDKLKDVGNSKEKVVFRGSDLESHPVYLFDLKPNFKKTYTRKEWNGGDKIISRTNEHSFRGDPLRNNSETRIIVYGDSNIQGRFSRLENTFPVKLEKYLNVLPKNTVEVLNGGVNGFGPDQSLLKMSSQIDVFKPEIIVFHVFADNDYGDLIRNQLFSLVDGKLTPRTGVFSRGYTELLQKTQEFSSSLLITRAARKLTREAVFWDADAEDPSEAKYIREKEGDLRKDLRSKIYSKPEYVEKLTSVTKTEFTAFKRQETLTSPRDHYAIDIALDLESESATTKVTLMESVLVEAHRVAQSKGLQLLVLIQPSWVDITTNSDALDHRYLAKHSSYDRERLSSIIKDICIRSGIPHINLYKTFSVNDPNKLYFQKNDNHWNDAGQDLAAREVARFIHRHFLKAGNRNFKRPF